MHIDGAIFAILIRCGLVLSVACSMASPASAAERPERPSGSPNVVMICIDDLNDWTGFLGGHPQAITPHMDALATRGVSFTNAHCAVPVCSASRVSVMSGLAATTHGSYELGPSYQQLPALRDIPTLQRCFKNQGYVTFAGGKVLHHGFTGRLAADIDHSFARTASPRPAQPLNRPPDWSGAWDWGAFPPDDADMADLQLARAAASAMQEELDQPFFMSIGFFRPHVPLYVPPHWFALYDEQQLTLPDTPLDDLSDLPSNFLSINEFAAAPTHADVIAAGKQRSLTHAYLAAISFVDHCVGIVIDALAKSPHAKNTVVVLWSDHGFHLGEKQHWAKRTLWEESTRVPLLVVGSGISAGVACREPVSLIDLSPTLLDICGLPAPAHLEGLSLVPQLRDPSTPRDRPAIISSYEGNHAVRTRDWRLIAYRDGSRELYDHRSDAAEFDNLANDPAHRDTRERLEAWLPRQAVAEFKHTSELALKRPAAPHAAGTPQE